MPYSHYHDWSFHTHRRKPRSGRHFRAVCRRQRPWRVGFGFALMAAAVLVAWNMGALGTAAAAVQGLFPDEAEKEAYRQKQAAEAERDVPTREPTVGARREVRRWEPSPPTPTRRPTPPVDLAAHEQAIVEVLNAERAKRGLGTLEWDAELHTIARAHSLDMAQGNYLEHVNPQGQDYRDRAVAAGYDCPNPEWQGVAENLHFAVRGYQEPEDPIDRWLLSLGHRMAMLDPSFSKAAIGIHEGEYQHYGHGQYTTLLLC